MSETLFTDGASSPKTRKPKSQSKGLNIQRVFSQEGQDPFDSLSWGTYDATIKNHKGDLIFEQKNVSFPTTWSGLAMNIAASKYFYGDVSQNGKDPKTGGRENSARQLVHRVTRTIADWGKEQGYFATDEDANKFYEELTWLCIHQYGAFNSPVWFNVGLYHQYGVKDSSDKTIWGWDIQKNQVADVDPYIRPQSSACFIIAVEDSIEDIWKLMAESARLFKYGSGVGADWSKLRSSREMLSGGGRPSGPVSFMRVQDSTGGTIKSGGKTRRAAIMQTLRVHHPDIMEFVEAKQEEEKKAWALIEEGYDGSFNGPAYGSVAFQNVNQSVRVTDEFMEAAERNETYALKAAQGGNEIDRMSAREVLNKIAEGTYICGDPGVQYEDTIQKWHTVPNSGIINSTNPCSEFVFLDDTACNLASLNLRKFQNEEGDLDIEHYRAACRIFITAQEILVDNGGYPSAAIAKNSHDFRPLGLGFANLGAFIMARGAAYDSAEGRGLAGAIMAIMNGEGYIRSAEIASIKQIGAFPGFEINREPMLNVMRMHRDAVQHIDPSCPQDLRDAAQETWDTCVAYGEAFGYRNAQVSVLAPTGTIGFLMDCDTTGVEPDIALVKYKLLAGKGDGMLKIVNQTVPPALKRLGYSESEIEAIIDYVDKNDTIEGAPHLKQEHLSVFDCAFKPFNGKRYIHHLGHVRMMAACQPFISGAISKCVIADTLINTEYGMIPIGNFYDGEAPDSFRRMKMQVASIDKNQEADLFYYGGVRDTIKLTLGDGRTLEGTPNHRVKVATKEGYDWKYLYQIQLGDHVAIRIGTDMWAQKDVPLNFMPSPLYGGQKALRIPETMNPDLAKFLGYYMAEGNKNKANWTTVITNNDLSILEKCQEIAEVQFGLSGRMVIDPRNDVKSIHFASKTLYEFLDYAGCGGVSGTKEMPWSILQSTKSTVQAFISGLYLDGYVRTKDGMIGICLKSQKLISQLQVVLNNFGIRGNIIQKHNKAYDRYFAELTIFGQDTCKFAQLFTFDEAHKAEKLQQVVAKIGDRLGSWADVIPCYREEMQQAVYTQQDTMSWRNLFDKRTQNISWQTAKNLYETYPVAELAEIVENNIHFVGVTAMEAGQAEVFDFQVPENHAFIGNGIINHNTVNMPENSTVEEIAETYMEGWKLGLKAVAIYRENSKRSQPLAVSKGGNTKKAVSSVGDGAVQEPEVAEKIVEKVVYKVIRKRLPDERPSITHKFSIGGHEGYLHIGLYPDTQMPGEIFITMAKQGSTISGLMDNFATAISLALQYGVPVADLCEKFSHTRFEPSGFTNNKEIPMAKSITDYIFRYLSNKFLNKTVAEGAILGDFESPASPVAQVQEPVIGFKINPVVETAPKVEGTGAFQNQSDAPSCPSCGSITVRSGSCYKCYNCGSTTGCS